MIRLGDLRVSPLLTPGLSGDPAFGAAGTALETLLRGVVGSTPGLLLWHRLALTAGSDVPAMLPPIRRVTESAGGLAPLSEAELELLAWQFHVDFREVASTREQLAELVRDAIPWHRIKGTPASIRAALALFGIDAEIEEGGPGPDWATYQLRLRNVDTLERARLAHRVALEMQPVRCRLGRVYNDLYDGRRIVWSEFSAWSDYVWSDDTGVVDPETGMVVSFGTRHAARSASPDVRVLAVRGDVVSRLIRYVDAWIWSFAPWSEVFPQPSGFVHGELGSRLVRRKAAPWSFMGRDVAREQLVWSEGDAGGGAWGDVNCVWTGGSLLSYEPWSWGASAWSEGKGPFSACTDARELEPRFRLLGGELVSTLAGFGEDLRGSLLTLYPERPWSGSWDARRWTPYPPILRFATDFEHEPTPWSVSPWSGTVW